MTASAAPTAAPIPAAEPAEPAEPAAPSLAPARAPRQVGKWTVAVSIALGSVMATIDTSIVNVALPQMMGNLGATLDEVAWVITAYVVANVIVVPMTGWLSSVFGRRNYFAYSIVLFTVASFFCGHATNIWELV
ncbi:MAG TPA: MFS transporter, partial [Kofleriaceae bacterium]|nr:MFS transporter [Kofleriaceae bacterium]